uniref:ead/Ea22-like family protein n=1 Tax=Clostridium perfringens TaxID=1502 RepID=UPI003221D7C1
MDKFSELKAAAMAATPGPWAAVLNGVWVVSDGTADFMLTDIFGDSELSAEQDRANAAFIAAANPAVVLELLAERDADKKRIAELEAIRSDASQVFKEIATELGCNPDNESIMMAIDDLKATQMTGPLKEVLKRNIELEAKTAMTMG